MIKQQNGVYTLPCIDIRHAYRPKGNNYLHLITFREADGSQYVAEELSSQPTSNFIIGQDCTFKLTHPGKNGGADWILFEGVGQASARSSHSIPQHVKTEQQQANGSPLAAGAIPKDDMSVAMIAFQCATQYGLKHDWNEEELVNKAYYFAGNIKRIAKQIAGATDI